MPSVDLAPGWFGCIGRATRRLPGAEAAADMRDRSEPHLVRGLGGQRRALTSRAEEHEALVLREHRLVVLARGINPEFEHAARAMERAGHAPVAVELADVAQVDEYDAVGSVQRKRVADRQRLDLALRRRDERIDMGGNFLRHGPQRWWAGREAAVKTPLFAC